MTINRFQLEQWADETDQRHGFDPGQMRRLIRQESGWNPAAVSPVGARGLTQFMPATAQEWGVDLNDPRSQIEKGGAYLAHLRDRYGGDMRKAIAAYNWGMGNLEKYGLENMPQETRNYLQNVYAGPGMPQTPQQPTQPVSAQPAPSVDDMLMTELMRPPERRQTNLYDIMGMAAPLVAMAGGNPQMATATTAIMQMIQGREQAERDAEESRQDRLMQMIALRRGTPTGTQTRDIQEYRLAQEQGYQGGFDDWIRQSTAWRNQRPAPTGTTRADFRVIGGKPYFVNEADQTLTPAEGFQPEQETTEGEVNDPNRVYFGTAARNEMEKEIGNTRSMLQRLQRMNEAWDPALYEFGGGSQQMLENFASRMGISPGDFTQRKNDFDSYLQELSGIIRNERFGAALTAPEKASAREFLPESGDSPQEIASKLSKLSELFQGFEERLFNDLNRGYFQREQWETMDFGRSAQPAPAPDIQQAPGGQPVDMNALPYQPNTPAPAPALPSGVDADLDAQIMSYGG